MPKHSDKSVTEIAEQAEEIASDEETLEDHLAEAEIPEAPVVKNPLSYVSLDSIAYYPTISKAREDANIPPHIQVKNLVDREILLYSKSPQKAALPDTGELRDGFFCTGIFVQEQTAFTTWIGQTALVRDLTVLTPPFRCTIVKHGRTYRFE